ncbi:MAG: flavin reductase family protein [Polyangiaceae bacterium]|nr:flavin reductase family protein [Polyangiaceae bacterium]
MAIDAAEFRKVLGQFASGVTVVTTAQDGAFFGMTASSFTSVSLDPPLVLFCADKRARSGIAVGPAGMFAVNILAEDQRELSEFFAGKGTDEERSDKLAAIGRTAITGAPVLDSALAWLDCRVDRAIDAGDHIIYVGLVVASAVRDGRDAPLVYWHGNYQHLDDETIERTRRS